MNPSRFQLLANMPLFGGITPATLEHLLSESSLRTVEAGKYFFKEHDFGESLFALEHGRVVVCKSEPEQEIELCELKEGDCFGEMALIDLGPRSASVRAKSACTAIEIPLRALYHLQQLNLAQFVIIQMNIGRELSRRLRKADARIFDLSQKTGYFDPCLHQWSLL